MFSKKMTNKSTNACLAQINRLKEKWKRQMPLSSGLVQVYRPLPDSPIPENGLTGIFQTLLLNMAFPICTPAAFIRLKP